MSAEIKAGSSVVLVGSVVEIDEERVEFQVGESAFAVPAEAVEDGELAGQVAEIKTSEGEVTVHVQVGPTLYAVPLADFSDAQPKPKPAAKPKPKAKPKGAK